jgi:hypothetical protein
MNKITVTHNAGFFSCSTVCIKTIIEYYNQHKVLPQVDRSHQYITYKDVDENIVPIFFNEEITQPHLEEIHWPSTEEDQFSNYKVLNFGEITPVINSYFKPSNYIENLKTFLLKKYQIDCDKTIAVYYRGTDKLVETDLPDYSVFLSKIEEVKNKYPDHKILVQSDEIEFYQFLASHHDIISFDETIKSNKGARGAHYIVPLGERTYHASLFLAIVLLMSKCDQLILNSGNVGLWCTLYRGHANGVHQYIRHKEFIYGTRNEAYGKQSSYWH